MKLDAQQDIRAKQFVVTDIETQQIQAHFWNLDLIPKKYRWAFKQMNESDCCALLCGKTLFQFVSS
jgi:hypothetical protein